MNTLLLCSPVLISKIVTELNGPTAKQNKGPTQANHPARTHASERGQQEHCMALYSCYLQHECDIQEVFRARPFKQIVTQAKIQVMKPA